MELFQEHFQTEVSTHLSTGSAINAQIKKAIAYANRAKEAYFEASSAYERVKNAGNNPANSEQNSEKQNRNLAQSRAMAKQATDRYILSIEQANGLWDEYDRVMPDVMLTLQQNYEGRIHFLKYTLERLTKSFLKRSQSESKVYTDFASSLNTINSNADIRFLVDSLRGKTVGVTRERFISYEEQKKQAVFSMNSEEDFMILEGVEPDEDVVRATKTVNHLYGLGMRDGRNEDRAITQRMVADMMEAMETREGRVAFLDVLLALRDSSPLSPEALTYLSSLFTCLLTNLQTQNDRDSIQICKIISLAENLSTETVGQRRYLVGFISNHPIWSDFGRWQHAIDTAIALRLASDRQSLEKLRKRKEGSVKSFFRAFKSFTTKIPVFQREQPEEIERSTSALVLSQFATYLRDFEVPPDFACEVLLACSQRAKLDGERVCGLLAELQASQVHAHSGDLELTDEQKSLKKREKERMYWKDILVLGVILQYLEGEELKAVLMLSRRVSHLVQRPIMRLLLLERKEMTVISREKVWMAALKPYALNASYESELQAVAFTALTKSLEDVIANDVVRSFQFSPSLSKDSLANILRAYAHFNSAVGYCQGMNYLFGTLYMIFQNEEAAFISGVGLINRYQMSAIFYTQLPRLKVMFYQLDRMIARFIPALQTVFRRESISASHFSSPWFMTLFSSSLQSDAAKFSVLLEIWDGFILVTAI